MDELLATWHGSWSRIPTRCGSSRPSPTRAICCWSCTWPQEDLGKVIGKQGRIARALRTIVKAAAVRTGRRVHVDIAE